MEKPLQKWVPKVTPWGRPPDPPKSRPRPGGDTTIFTFENPQGRFTQDFAKVRKRVQTRLPVGTHDRGIRQILRQGFWADPLFLLKSDI